MPVKKIPKNDIKFLAFAAESLLSSLKNTDQEHERLSQIWSSGTLPSMPKDIYVLLSIIVTITGSYLRARGLKRHPASKTEKEHLNTEASIIQQMFQEVIDRPYLYPWVKRYIDQGTIDVQLDEILREKRGGS